MEQKCQTVGGNDGPEYYVLSWADCTRLSDLHFFNERALPLLPFAVCLQYDCRASNMVGDCC
jgi:hypothetical protein